MSTRRPPRRTNGAGRGPSGPAGRGPRTMTPGGGGSCLLALIVGILVVGTALVLTPLAVKVWTTAWIPAANRVHFGDGLVVALTLAGFALYLLTSLLFVHRRPISPAGSVPVLRGAGTSSRPGVSVLDVARGEPRSEGTAAGVSSPGPTPAATTTAGAA